jgi:hypothetical protein
MFSALDLNYRFSSSRVAVVVVVVVVVLVVVPSAVILFLRAGRISSNLK